VKREAEAKWAEYADGPTYKKDKADRRDSCDAGDTKCYGRVKREPEAKWAEYADGPTYKKDKADVGTVATQATLSAMGE
jgi:hypothetical protein